MERKVVVQQKIVDDTYIDKCFIWEVVDENGAVYARGEGVNMLACVEEGRKHLNRKRPLKES